MSLLPKVDPSEEILRHVHPIDALNPQQKKGIRNWKPCYILTSFSTPTPVTSNTIKKKFKIRFRYFDPESNKQRTCVVHFGTQSDYIFSKDNKLRLRKLMTMKHLDNPFRGNYWSSWLTNKYQTMQQGFNQLQRHVMHQNSKLGKDFPNLSNKQLNKKPLQLKPLK